MMFGFDGGGAGWVWAVMALGMFVFSAFALTGAAVGIRSYGRRKQLPAERSRQPVPEQILAQRFAQGDIDAAEYTDRVVTLRALS